MSLSKINLVVSLLALIFLSASCSHPVPEKIEGFDAPLSNSRDRLWDDNWLFFRGDIANAENPDFDDVGWRQLDLPHDWSIEDVPEQIDPDAIGPFSRKSEGSYNTCNVLGGIGWYRKHFTLVQKSTSPCFLTAFT